jgi:hypothetical protein
MDVQVLGLKYQNLRVGDQNVTAGQVQGLFFNLYFIPVK